MGGNGAGCHNEIPPTLYYTVYPGENVSGEGFRSNLDYISVALGREGMTILWNIFLPPPPHPCTLKNSHIIQVDTLQEQKFLRNNPAKITHSNL
jgi:hypothetical protein